MILFMQTEKKLVLQARTQNNPKMQSVHERVLHADIPSPEKSAGDHLGIEGVSVENISCVPDGHASVAVSVF